MEESQKFMKLRKETMSKLQDDVMKIEKKSEKHTKDMMNMSLKQQLAGILDAFKW